MPNAVLQRLESQRAEQITFVDNLLARVDSDGRDLVDAEQANLTSARERIAEIDAQLAPLRDFENLRGAAAEGSPFTPGAPGEPRPLGGGGGPFPYRTAGAWLVDHVRARAQQDPAAQARLAEAARHQAIATQTTQDTPGLLPTPIIGPVVNTIDASRPFITSIGALPLDNPGAGFIRPKVTQHVDVGLQAGEKTELASRKMVIGQVPFSKKTYGGTVNVSRQDLDWTSPSAWDALTQDLADVYGAETEAAVAADFAALVVQAVSAPATGDLAGWAEALYAAAAKCYMGGAAAGTTPMGRLPNRMWVSLDMWGAIGALVDINRMVAGGGAAGVLGDSNLASFSGDILSVPRIVVPSFPAGTVILGPSNMYEFREQTIGLLTAVEPAILGLEVAYGGYTAYGMIEANAFCKVPAPAPLGARATTAK